MKSDIISVTFWNPDFQIVRSFGISPYVVEHKSGQGVVADHLKVVAQSCIDCLARPEGSPVSSTTKCRDVFRGPTPRTQWEGGYIFAKWLHCFLQCLIYRLCQCIDRTVFWFNHRTLKLQTKNDARDEMGEDPNVKVFFWYLTENQQMIQQLVVFWRVFLSILLSFRYGTSFEEWGAPSYTILWNLWLPSRGPP